MEKEVKATAANAANEVEIENEGWRTVQIDQELPLSAIVHFLNILNQRLCTIEDLISVKDDKDGNSYTLTEIYHMQAMAAEAKEDNNKENKE